MEQRKSIGIKIDECQGVVINDNHFENLEEAIVATRSRDVSLTNNVITGTKEVDLDELKEVLIQEIETIIADAKKGKKTNIEQLTNFLIQTGSGFLLGILRAKGIID